MEISQFEDIIVKTGSAGRVTRVGDVARVELGGQNYDFSSQLSGTTAGLLAIYQLPGANALDVADQVAATMERLSKNFPEGLDYEIPFDTTLFVRASIHEVYVTLFQAALLVFLVPPNWAELERRLRGRGTDDSGAIARRLATAKEELAMRDGFDLEVVNDESERAAKTIETALG